MATDDPSVPPLVAAAALRASEAGFTFSCEPEVGALLAVLAAHLPAGGRVLELGTGVGVGTAWIVSGLAGRTDVSVTSVEADQRRAELAAAAGWPAFVDLRHGDALDILAASGEFDLIFADAPAGKWTALHRTIAALRPHGMLMVDDMTPMPHWDDQQRTEGNRVRGTLLAHPGLRSVELGHGSGVILSTRIDGNDLA
jgi:demethylmenaquinone methyltransferase/2-methoxy-6-polyprenyl-1,4-benzoquinol methylase